MPRPFHYSSLRWAGHAACPIFSSLLLTMLFGTVHVSYPNVHRICKALKEMKWTDLEIRTKNKIKKAHRSETMQFSTNFCVVIWNLNSKYETYSLCNNCELNKVVLLHEKTVLNFKKCGHCEFLTIWSYCFVYSLQHLAEDLYTMARRTRNYWS
jgi:hypothetical protein